MKKTFQIEGYRQVPCILNKKAESPAEAVALARKEDGLVSVIAVKDTTTNIKTRDWRGYVQ